jgi:hypothetical protein
MTTCYTTESLVKQYIPNLTYDKLGFASDAAFTAAIAALLPDINSAIDNYTHRQFFKVEDATEIFDGEEQLYLFPVHTPILELTKVEYRSGQDAAWAELTLTDYYAYDEYIACDCRFAAGLKNYRITFDHGYNAVPGAVSRAATQIAVNVIRQWRLDAVGVVVPSGNFTVKAPLQDFITPSEELLLAPYVKPIAAIA